MDPKSDDAKSGTGKKKPTEQSYLSYKHTPLQHFTSNMMLPSILVIVPVSVGCPPAGLYIYIAAEICKKKTLLICTN